MKLWVYQALKMVLGAFIAIELSSFFKLDNTITAGIIVLLSVQNTKRKSLDMAFKRIIAALTGLLIVTLLFMLFGFHLYLYIVALALFIPLCFIIKVEDGIVVSAVLMSHLLIYQSLEQAINASYLLIIGIVTALILNLYMPSARKTIDKEISDIDNCLKTRIERIANENYNQICALQSQIKQATSRIKMESDNRFISPKDMNIDYVYMRKDQYRYVLSIEKDFQKVSSQILKEPIKALLLEISKGIGKDNMAKPLLEELYVLRNSYQKKPLPQTREEFEQRAILFHILYDIESFLLLKIEYHNMNDQN